MNLVEQLGGYERAKEKMDNIVCTLDNSELLGGGDAREGLYERLESIDKALLEYRRQHNIFEVGDKVVAPILHGCFVGKIIAYRSDIDRFDVMGSRHWVGFLLTSSSTRQMQKSKRVKDWR